MTHPQARRRAGGRYIRNHWQLYAFLAVPLVFLLLFAYLPMYGVVISFQDFKLTRGILDSRWVGMKHFINFFTSRTFASVVRNTFVLSAASIVASFPFPILLALMLNEIAPGRFKKTVQMVTYAPYFISTVVLVSMLMQFFAPNNGIVNIIVRMMGGLDINFMGRAEYFRPLYVGSGIWQGTGFSAVLYIAALSAVDPTLYEAARIDGANRLQKILHIDIPSILPTATIMLILSFGQIMNLGYEKAYLMQNNTNLDLAEILSTYVYKIGLLNLNFSQSAAIGLCNSVVNLIMLLLCNAAARRLGETSLW